MRYIITLLFSLFLFTLVKAQDTFSIVAIDPVTGQVGSAGASCVTGSIILSDIHPGRGVIHSQASYLAANQTYARTLMNRGYSPQQIIDSMIARDAQNNPTIRQYGIVDLIGGGRTAAYTGVNCTNYKNHILGPTYSIQGNILAGQYILDSMQARFLRTNGSLSDKLMAALQGAKVPGADTRCLSRGTSSISGFLRVARPQDTTGTYWLDLNVNNTPVNRDPIDSLQILYNQWILTGINPSLSVPGNISMSQNYPNPFNPSTTIEYSVPEKMFITLKLYNELGKEIRTLAEGNKESGNYKVTITFEDLSAGVYYIRLTARDIILTRKLALVK
jgi:uncharacterized Ntn-hydrolase superfamily protein